MGKVVQLCVATAILAMTASAASAQLLTTVSKKRAPAPLLAAGVPAFIALGVGAGIGRVVRRRKGVDQTKGKAELPE